MIRFHSLRTPLNLLLAAAILLASLSIYQIMANALEATLMQRENDQAASIHTLSVNIFANEIDGMMILASTIAKQKAVVEGLDSLVDVSEGNHQQPSFYALEQELNNLSGDLGGGRSLSILYHNGLQLYHSDDSSTVLSLFDWGVSEALSGESVLVTSKDAGHWTIRALVPIQAGTETLGVLMVSVNLSDILIHVESIVETNLFLINLDGYQVGTSNSEKFSAEIDNPALLKSVLDEKQIKTIISDDQLLLHYYRVLSVVDETFCLLIETDLRPAQNLLSKQRRESLKIILLVMAVALFLCSLACWLLLRPLKRLRARVDGCAEPFNDANSSSTKGDEVASLIRAFSSMFERLKKHEEQMQVEQERLETRVQTKKFQLNQKDEQLNLEVEERRLAERKLQEKEQNLLHLTTHDPLTGLPNRIQMNACLRAELESALRENRKASFLFIDVDRFKIVNDTVGHTAGDLILAQVAARLKMIVRQSDVLAHLGGDEFVIFSDHLTDPELASRLARRILKGISPPFYVAGKPFYLTVSIGISSCPDDGWDVESLLVSANVAMHRIKKLGGSDYQIYTQKMNSRVHEMLELERGLHTCLEKGQLLLHYQPQIDLNTGELIGVEALLRWQMPERGLVQPNDFIPLAEQTGLIVPMGEWVLEEACRQYVTWQKQGFLSGKMAVNISPRQFWRGNLIDVIPRILQQTGMSPTNLELEITESMVMEDVEAAIKTMQGLVDMGISMAIDDFGSGYSSLTYLKKFPISKLKIDRAFVRDLPNDENDIAIVTAAISLAESMDLTIIAEGIETQEQVEFFRQQGSIIGQGFLFGRPAEPAKIEERWSVNRDLGASDRCVYI